MQTALPPKLSPNLTPLYPTMISPYNYLILLTVYLTVACNNADSTFRHIQVIKSVI